MDKVIYFAGIGSFVGGVFLIIYQALMLLMHNVWNQYTLLTVAEKGPGSITNTVAANPQMAKILESCPLFIALILLGFFLMLIGSRLGSRYTG